MSGIDTIYDLAETGLLESALEDGEVANCAGCVFAGGQICDAGCGYGGSVICGALSLSFAGGVACVVAVTTICSYPCTEAGVETACSELDFC